MDNNHHINRQIEDALNSLDGAGRATASPWLLTRIQARLSQKQQSAWDKISVFISRPSVALPALLIVLMINAGAIFFTNNGSTTVTVEQVSPDTADELPLNNGSFYDLVNTTP